MPFRTVFATLTASLVIHGFVGYSLYLPWSQTNHPAEEFVMISYMPKEEKSPAPNLSQEKSGKSQKILEKRMKRIAEKNKAPAPVKISASATDFFRHEEEKSRPSALASKIPPVEKHPAVAQFSLPKSSAEFMADPKKSRIFVNYFGLVKEKIYRTLRDKYARESGGKGSVSLSFVLSVGGRLQKVEVNEKESSADAFLKNLAVECLKDSAPFAAIPNDLDSRQITFSLTIYFDEI